DPTSGRVNRRSFVSRVGHRIELLDTRTGPSGVRLASGDERLEVRLDERNEQIDITLRGAGRAALSSVTLTERGITIDAGTGELTLRGRSVSVAGTTGIQLDGGAQAVLRGRVVRIN
ncbi:MAG: hypothetical protein V7637_2193, partial [Mycobacteriales bacterium]